MRLVQRTCVIQKNHSNKMKQNFKISFIRADSFETIIQNPSHLLQRTENMLSLSYRTKCVDENRFQALKIKD